jgi:hypothetical protein
VEAYDDGQKSKQSIVAHSLTTSKCDILICLAHQTREEESNIITSSRLGTNVRRVHVEVTLFSSHFYFFSISFFSPITFGWVCVDSGPCRRDARPLCFVLVCALASATGCARFPEI